MKWSNEKPTATGGYWTRFRRKDGTWSKPWLVWVQKHGRGFIVIPDKAMPATRMSSIGKNELWWRPVE